MAEARVAMLSHDRKRGFRLGVSNLNDGYIEVKILVPHPKTVKRGFFKTLFNVQRKFLYGLWPLSPFMATVITAVICVAVLRAGEDSWLRTGWLATFLWDVDTMITFNWWQELCSHGVRAFYLAVLGSGFLVLLLMMVHRYLFRLILGYRGWLYAAPPIIEAPSLQNKIWFWIVRRFRGRKPLLYSYQGSLPRLPVPQLQDTVDRYLQSVQAVLGGPTSQEYMSLSALAERFMEEEGPSIQRILRVKAMFQGNYVTEWWEKYVYLNNRIPLMINSNYYILGSIAPPTSSQTARAAVLVHLFARFKRLVDREQLKPLFIRDIAPTCMNQYRRLFATTRVPDRDCDELMHFRSYRHVVILRNGYYFKLNVLRWDGALYSASQLQQALEKICEEADAREFPDYASGGHLGAFTAADRTSWATSRETYFSEGLNKASLRAIEHAIFFVSLDKPQSMKELVTKHRAHVKRAQAQQREELLRQQRAEARALSETTFGPNDNDDEEAKEEEGGQAAAAAAAVQVVGAEATWTLEGAAGGQEEEEGDNDQQLQQIHQHNRHDQQNQQQQQGEGTDQEASPPLAFVEGDDRTPEELREAFEWTMRGRSLMHGDGTNRWFDKSLTLVVFPDGQAGLNVEHTFADAPCVAHLWEFALTHEWHTHPYATDRVTGRGGDCVQRGVDENTRRVEFGALRRSPSVNNVMLFMQGIADDDDGAEDSDAFEAHRPDMGDGSSSHRDLRSSAIARGPRRDEGPRRRRAGYQSLLVEEEDTEEEDGTLGTGANTFHGAQTLREQDEDENPNCCDSRRRSRRMDGPVPARLRFSIPEEGQASLRAAVSTAATAIADLDLCVMKYNHYGKGFIKSRRISPDAYIQMALQVANYRDTGRFALTYEASMTRLFYHGRTETVRPASQEAFEFVEAMGLASAPTPPPITQAQRQERQRLLRKACEVHVRLYKDAMAGKGIDRHMFALLVLSKGMGVESEFLRQARSIPWGLSSSQEPQRQQPKWWKDIPEEQMETMVSWGGGFGPVANDGYGVSYMVREDAIYFHISSQVHAARTNSARFAQHLRRAFADIRDVIRD